MSQNNIFFISGRGRSGTWLLQAVLDYHVDVVVAPESIFIQMLKSKYGKLTNWSEKKKLEFAKDVLKEDKMTQWWKLDENDLINEVLKVPNLSSYAEFCKIPYRLYADEQKEGASLIGDKNPEYSLCAEDLLEMYSESKFVFLVRDPRDNVMSYKNVNFDLNDGLALAARWNHYSRAIEKVKSAYPDRVLIQKFEDLILEPQESLKRITSFLNIEYYEELLNFYKHSKNVFEWNKKIKQPFDNSAVLKWKKNEITPEILKISKVSDKYIKAFGYESIDEVKLSLKDRFKVFMGKFISILEETFFKLPLSLKVGILRVYRMITKTFS